MKLSGQLGKHLENQLSVGTYDTVIFVKDQFWDEVLPELKNSIVAM